MTSRQIATGLAAALLLALAPPATFAQTAAEQAEIDAAAAAQPGPPPVGNGVGIVCPPGTAPVDFYFSDFEANNGGWTGTGLAPWEHGPVVTGVFENCDTVPEDEPAGAFSGVNVWATNLNGCHANSGSASLLSQTFDFAGAGGTMGSPASRGYSTWAASPPVSSAGAGGEVEPSAEPPGAASASTSASATIA